MCMCMGRGVGFVKVSNTGTHLCVHENNPLEKKKLVIQG